MFKESLFCGLVLSDGARVSRQSATVTVLSLLIGGLLLASNAFGLVARPGQIAGTFGVSPMGAATYAIPIAVPEGMLGLRPDISLVYSSQGGDGLAGVGWTLAGFSKIARCPLTIEVDTKVQGVQYTAEDRFCLDGDPLVFMSTVGGVKEYRTEIYQHQQIKASIETVGSGPKYFIVKQPNGTTLYYGKDDDSRIEAPGTGGEVRVWAITEVVNTSGHKIHYKYVEDGTNGEYYPDEVRWTYAADETISAAKYLLKFVVEVRNDSRTGYVSGSKWQTSKRLASIQYKYNDTTLVHTYTLGYQYGATGRSQLTSVLETGPDDSLPTTQMLWVDGVSGFSGEASLPNNNSAGGVFYADFNGDGDMDIYRQQIVSGNLVTWRLMFSNGDGTFQSSVDTGLDIQISGQTVLDINGDGRSDLLYNNDNGDARMAFATGNELQPTSAFSTPTTVPGLPPFIPPNLVPMDVNGDGRDDLVAPANSHDVFVRLSNGSGFTGQPYTTLPGGGTVELYLPGPLRPADFDGDGRADLLVARGPGASRPWEAYLSNGVGFNTSAASLGTAPYPNGVIVVDINGDGLSDVLMSISNTWQTRLSTGKAGSAFIAPTCATTVSSDLAKASVIDYNGDGRMDILRPNGTGWRVQLSDGSCYTTSNYVDLLGGTNPGSILGTAGVDVTGEGTLDIVLAPTSPNAVGFVRVHSSATEGPVSDVVKRITDGLDNYHAPKYQVLSNWSGYHASGTDDLANGIRLKRGGPFGVVSEYDANTGVGSGFYTVTNQYWNARTNVRGRGFLGFANVKAVDSRNNVATDTLYRQFFPYTGQIDMATTCTGATAAAALCSSGTAKIITRYDPTWSEKTQSVPAGETATYHFPYIASDIRERREVEAGPSLGAVVTSTNRTLTNWDFEHGIAKTETSVTTSPQGGGTWTTTKTLVLNDDLKTTSWCLRLPSEVNTVKSISGVSNPITDPVRTVQLLYHPNCAPKEERVGPKADETKQLKTFYGIDGYGRLATITRGPGNVDPEVVPLSVLLRKTIISYDADGYRPASESFVVNQESDHVVGHTWDNALAFEIDRTSVQGQVTHWQSDDFGRVLSETRPVGSSTFGYTKCGVCFPTGAKYSIQETRSDSFSQTISYDSLARMVGRTKSLITGDSQEEFGYDSVGNMTSQTVPYVVGDTVYTIDRLFDITGRPTSETRATSEADPSPTYTYWSYDRLTTSVTKALLDPDYQVINYTSDPEGRLSAVDVPLPAGLNGDATYGYNAWGELKTVQDAAGHLTTMYYDDRGFRYQVDDPDAGSRTTQYNVFGEPEKVKDAVTPVGSWTTQTIYDQLGRPNVRVDIPADTTIWTYQPLTGSEKGLLKNVVSPTASGATGFDETYLYNSLAQLKTVTTKINGTSYLTDYTYNGQGQLDVMTYPAGIGGIRYAYKHTWTKGYLNTIAPYPGQVPIYDVVSMDALARETRATLGSNVLDSQHIYDRASTRINEIKAGPSLGSTLQWYTYNWDKAGNLRQRINKNNATPITEDFGYDRLNRLTSIRLNDVQTQAYQYLADGNIEYRTDGDLSYFYGPASGHPHATASTVYTDGCMSLSETYDYNANGSMILRNGGAITYTAFDRPKQINLLGTGCTGDCSTFTYGPDRNMILQVDKKSNATRTIVYVGPHFEVETSTGVTKYRSHIFANDTEVYTQLSSTGTDGLQAYWPLRDHLGSVDTLRRETGLGEDGYRFSFAAFGKRRNAIDWTPDSNDALQVPWNWDHRGFTDHETLDTVKLIHMKGRVYDPKLGRMLSPDPVLGELTAPQTLNAYSYVANNPLAYTDPDGLFLGKVFDEIFGAWGKQVLGNVFGFAIGGAVCDPESTTCSVAANFAGRTVASGGDGLYLSYGRSFGGQRSTQISDIVPQEYVLNQDVGYYPMLSETALVQMDEKSRQEYYESQLTIGRDVLVGEALGFGMGAVAARLYEVFRILRPAEKIADATLGVNAVKTAEKTVDKFSRNPKSLMDEMVLDAAKQGKGIRIIENLGDAQFKGMEKWSYGETSANGLRSEVHYVRDPKTGELMDFKFKIHAEP